MKVNWNAWTLARNYIFNLISSSNLTFSLQFLKLLGFQYLNISSNLTFNPQFLKILGFQYWNEPEKRYNFHFLWKLAKCTLNKCPVFYRFKWVFWSKTPLLKHALLWYRNFENEVLKLKTKSKAWKEDCIFHLAGNQSPYDCYHVCCALIGKYRSQSLKQVLYRTLYPRNTRALVWYSSRTHWLLSKCLFVIIYFTQGSLRTTLCPCC